MTCTYGSRRDFLKVGTFSIGVAGISLTEPNQATAAGGSAKSVVWLWLGGGPSHIETFDPKPDAPSEYRNVTGAVQTAIPGVALGGTFERIAAVADRMAFVRSFGHSVNSHGRASHLLHTGHDDAEADDCVPQIRPSIGSVLAWYRGPVHSQSGLPAYIRFGATAGDGAGMLGPAFEPQNWQAYRSHPACDLTREDSRTREQYGRGLGEQLLLARRLCEAGVGFISIHHPGWDLHGDIARGLKRLGPFLDRAVAAFVEDCVDRGLDRDILLVVTGEFGRTPRINVNGGRDHWPPLGTLALSGGGLRMGQVIGESTVKAESQKSNPVSPHDLLATVAHVLGLPTDLSVSDASGRPTPIFASGRPILELI